MGGGPSSRNSQPAARLSAAASESRATSSASLTTVDSDGGSATYSTSLLLIAAEETADSTSETAQHSASASQRRVTWSQETCDNEHLNKRKSKGKHAPSTTHWLLVVCCIFHRSEDDAKSDDGQHSLNCANGEESGTEVHAANWLQQTSANAYEFQPK